MTKTDAELIRHALMLLESAQDQPEHMDENWLTDKAGEMLGTAAGKGRIQRKAALDKYWKLYKTYMARVGQTYENVTWKTLLNFLVSAQTVKSLPLEGQGKPLTSAEVYQMLKDPAVKARIQTMVKKKVPGFDVNDQDQFPVPLKADVLPKPLHMGMPMDKPGDQKKKAYWLSWAILSEAITELLEKAAPAGTFSPEDEATNAASRRAQMQQALQSAGITDAAKLNAILDAFAPAP